MRLIYLKPGKTHIIENRQSIAAFESEDMLGINEVNYLMSYKVDILENPDPDPNTVHSPSDNSNS